MTYFHLMCSMLSHSFTITQDAAPCTKLVPLVHKHLVSICTWPLFLFKSYNTYRKTFKLTFFHIICSRWYNSFATTQYAAPPPNFLPVVRKHLVYNCTWPLFLIKSYNTYRKTFKMTFFHIICSRWYNSFATTQYAAHLQIFFQWYINN